MFFPGRMSFLLSASPWKQRWLFHGSHAPCRLQALLQAHVGSTAIFPPLLSHRVLCLLSRYSGRGRPSWSRHLEGHSRYICMAPRSLVLVPCSFLSSAHVHERGLSAHSLRPESGHDQCCLLPQSLGETPLTACKREHLS